MTRLGLNNAISTEKALIALGSMRKVVRFTKDVLKSFQSVGIQSNKDK